MSKPVPTLVAYYPKPGKEEDLLALIRTHYPTLDRLGLATKTPPRIWKARDKRGDKDRVYFLELFEWKDEKASDVAHQTPEVMAVWEPMGNVMDDMSITKVEPIA